jgi:S-formylglutathione hydrolase FrmB
MLAVHTSPEHEKHIASILRDAGGAEVERALGRWNQGKWEDFDPLVSPDLEKNF